MDISIEVTSTELWRNMDKILAMPEGTVINEVDDTPDEYIGYHNRLLQWQVIPNQKLDLIRNHYDWERPLSQQEKDRIKLTKLSIAKYFVEKSNDAEETYGEFKVYSEAEYNFFKHVRHAGSYLESKPRYNVFHILMNKDQPIEPAIKEVKFILALQAKQHPKKKWISFSIFEHNLSAGGSYNLDIHVDKKTCKIVQSYSIDRQFPTLEAAMTYIKNNLWYQEKTDDADDE